MSRTTKRCVGGRKRSIHEFVVGRSGSERRYSLVTRRGCARTSTAAGPGAPALELYYLPPYSPEPDPDELVWNDLKNKALGRKMTPSREVLQKLAVSHLRRLQQLPRLVASFFHAPSTFYASA